MPLIFLYRSFLSWLATREDAFFRLIRFYCRGRGCPPTKFFDFAKEDNTMRKELYFDAAVETLKDYLTRIAPLLDSENKELSDEEKQKLSEYAAEQWTPDFFNTVRMECRANHFDQETSEIFLERSQIYVVESIYKFNNPKYREDATKVLSFQTFVKNCIKRAVRESCAEKAGVSYKFYRREKAVEDAAVKASMNLHIPVDMVTAQMLKPYLSIEISKKTINAYLSHLRGTESVDIMLDMGADIQDTGMDVEAEAMKDEALDPETIKILDELTSKLSKLDVFLLLYDLGAFDDYIKGLTAAELSKTKIFEQLLQQDKNVRSEDGTRIISNKRKKNKEALIEIGKKVPLDDLEGRALEYFLKKYKDM
jgi:hypothetical protein